MKQDGGKLWTLAQKLEGPLAEYLGLFARHLDGQGFDRRGLGPQIRTAAKFSRWLQTKGIAAALMTDEHAQRFLDEPEQQGVVVQGGAAILRRLINYLRCLGICSAPTPDALTLVEQVIAAYAGHLRKDQGLSGNTLLQYCPFAKAFLLKHFGTGLVDLSILQALDVIEFVQQQAANLSPARAKASTIALRSFLRYILYCGGTKVNLASAVPTVPNWSMTGIPRAIAPNHLRAVLAGCRRDTPIGRRDYAILMLLAHLGLRSSEVVSLTLDSVGWEDGSIAILGKGNQPAILPLPAEVGEAIAEYLQWGRQVCASRALFLRANAPIRGLGSQTTVGTIVGAAIRRAGVRTRYHGSHQFRHALAANMLRGGSTLTEIGSLLRHRHPKTTGIYAKIDFEALRPLSQPWPGDAQ